MIPSLAVSALSLAGTACGGGDGTGEYVQDALSSAINAFCMKVAQCYPGYDPNECVGYEQRYADYIRNYGADCVNAVASYLECLSELSCDDYMNVGPGFEACQNEVDIALETACTQ